MKKALIRISVGALALCAGTGTALADVAVDEIHTKPLGQALMNSLIFAAVGMLAVFAAVIVFDKATPRIDIQKELLDKNVAVAIVTGAVVLGVSLIVAASIM